jgi:hypothetical protein
MTDATPLPLTLVGDPKAAACEGDYCEVPAVTGRAAVTRLLDENNI